MITILIVRQTKKKCKNISYIFYKGCKKEKSFGMNRVIVQVRPFGDAVYKSKYFPWSKYISGKQEEVLDMIH